MKSIRLSLIVYFLVLLTVALGAVSWSSYQTTAQALRDRQADAQKMIETQCDARSKAVRADLDRHILLKARTMANMSRSMLANTEGLVVFGAIGAAGMPQGYLNIPVWLTQATYSPWLQEGKYPFLAKQIFLAQPIRTHIEDADDLVPSADDEHAQEYFQTFRHNGHPMQRSKSMGEHSFVLDDDVREKVMLTESFDEVDIGAGVKAARVTLKTTVPRLRFFAVSWPWRSPPYGPPTPKNFKGPSAGSRPPRGLGGFESVAPVVFIQYASDLGPAQAKIRDLQQERETQLNELSATIDNDLRQLRTGMLWIALGTLTGIWIGGYVLVRLGLSPLSRMSEAVSQVSAQNFQLPLDVQNLPHELQPIAATLVETLEQLRKAFDREKQAAADISHELRTPLAALMTTLEVGLRKSRSLEEYREILQDCHFSGRHMYQLVERLLALARLDAGADLYRPVPVDAIDLALQCADLIRPLAKARALDLRLDLPDAVTVQTDPNKLREVLINLLHNAVEYNKPNGSIELSVEQFDGFARFEVRDTGIGIGTDALAHIFERFYRADPSRHADTPHAGLGLAIVKSYIDLMHGKIQVASSSAGTTFTLDLPLGEAPLATETGIRPEPALIR